MVLHRKVKMIKSFTIAIMTRNIMYRILRVCILSFITNFCITHRMRNSKLPSETVKISFWVNSGLFILAIEGLCINSSALSLLSWFIWIFIWISHEFMKILISLKLGNTLLNFKKTYFSGGPHKNEFIKIPYILYSTR